jgi:hypothetical protein
MEFNDCSLKKKSQLRNLNDSYIALDMNGHGLQLDTIVSVVVFEDDWRVLLYVLDWPASIYPLEKSVILKDEFKHLKAIVVLLLEITS